MTQTELADKLTALTDQVTKIGTETQGLKDAIEAAGTITPEVQTALANLENAVKGVDDLVPDATEPIEPEEPETPEEPEV